MVAGIIVVELLDVALHVTLWTVKTTFGGVYNLIKYVTSPSTVVPALVVAPDAVVPDVVAPDAVVVHSDSGRS
jgi:uncharacterized membrane protein